MFSSGFDKKKDKNHIFVSSGKEFCKWWSPIVEICLSSQMCINRIHIEQGVEVADLNIHSHLYDNFYVK